MNKEQINKRFCELAGIHWHHYIEDDNFVLICSCGHKTYFYENCCANPDFCDDPRLVLEVMMKREDFTGFLNSLDGRIGDWQDLLEWFIYNYMIDKTGQLALKAISWMEEKA